MAASPGGERYGLTPRATEEQTYAQKNAERSKENERKEKDNVLKAETVGVTKYAQVQPSTTESKSTETKVHDSSASSSPIRRPSSKTKSETLVKVTDEHITNASIDSNSASPVRITSENITTQSMASIPPAIAKSSVWSSSSSSSPIHTSHEHKETVPKPSALELDSTNKEGKAIDNSLPNAGGENTAVMVATSTSITLDKEIDKKPVLAEPMLALKVAKATQEQIVPISEKNSEFDLLVLKTQTRSSQITFQGDRTETTEDVNSKLDYYFNPFLAGMAMWQGWLDMYNEFIAINIRLSLNWLNSYRNY